MCFILDKNLIFFFFNSALYEGINGAYGHSVRISLSANLQGINAPMRKIPFLL